jgi:hypothetical protein
VYFAGTTLDGQMFGSASAYTSTKVMIAKMSVNLAGTSYIYTWAKAYCIKCALGNSSWSETVNVKDILYSSSGFYIYVAVQANTDGRAANIRDDRPADLCHHI